MCVPCALAPADRLAALAPHQPSWLRRKSPDSSPYYCNHSYQAGSPRAALLICGFIHEERRPLRVALILQRVLTVPASSSESDGQPPASSPVLPVPTSGAVRLPSW